LGILAKEKNWSKLILIVVIWRSHNLRLRKKVKIKVSIQHSGASPFITTLLQPDNFLRLETVLVQFEWFVKTFIQNQSQKVIRPPLFGNMLNNYI
jgi:hypothetical protein